MSLCVVVGGIQGRKAKPSEDVLESGLLPQDVIVRTADDHQEAWRSRQVMAERSGHQIQKDHPELVIELVSELVVSYSAAGPRPAR